MSSINPRPCIILAATSLMLAGCSETSSAPQTYDRYAKAPEFSEADKAVARALSLGDDRSLEKLKEPGARAIACSQAIGEIAAKLRDVGGIGEEQIVVLERARKIYADQIPADAAKSLQVSANGDGPDDQADSDAASVKSGQTAIVCLRKLQDE
ncbi:hypothetical protein [Tsuneonella suprasediminis]|uniref:hypothetical protein n=1 Tax=Tsuneonella suprasediminis TaxID=2306996 RepID=UPI002F92F821